MNNNRITVRSVSWLLLLVSSLHIILLFVLDTLFTFFPIGTTPEWLASLVTQIFCVALPTFYFLRTASPNVHQVLRIKPLRPDCAIIIALAGFCMQMVAKIVNLPMQIILDSNTTSVHQNVFVSILTVALLPAIFEELLMRGVVLNAFRRCNRRRAIVASAFLFALLHLDLGQFVGYFVLGIFFAYVVIRTGSIYAGIIAHFFNNLSGIIWGIFYQSAILHDRIVLIVVLLGLLALMGLILVRLLHSITDVEDDYQPMRGSLTGFPNFPVLLLMLVFIVDNFILPNLI